MAFVLCFLAVTLNTHHIQPQAVIFLLRAEICKILDNAPRSITQLIGSGVLE